MTQNKDRRMRVRITYIIILALILAAGLGALGVTLGIFSAQMPKNPVRVENESGQEYLTMGLLFEDKLLLQMPGSEPMRQAVFPGELLEGAERGQVVGISADGQAWLSPVETLEGKNRLPFQYSNLAAETDPALLRRLPGLSGWTLSTEANLRTAAFKGDTPLQYRVYLLGKGGRLSLSDWGSADAPVSASWEKGRGSPQSWLLLQGN